MKTTQEHIEEVVQVESIQDNAIDLPFLPPEIITYILTFLPVIDLKNTKSVCKNWNLVASELLQKKGLSQFGISQQTINSLKSKDVVCKRLSHLLLNQGYSNFFYKFYCNSGNVDENLIYLLDDNQQWFDTFFSKQDKFFLEYHFAVACRNGNLSLVQYLINQHKIEPFYRHVRYAAYSGDLNLVKYLLEEKKCDFSEDDDTHGIFTPAIVSRNLALVKYLIEKFEMKPNGIHFKIAIAGGSVELVSYLYENYKLTSNIISPDIVTSSKSLKFLKYMLDNLKWVPIDDECQDPTLKMQNGIKKLMKAAYATGKLEIVKYVESRFACPTHLDMLIDAVTSCNLETFIYCIEKLKINPSNLKNYIDRLERPSKSSRAQPPIESDQMFLNKIILSGSFDTFKFLIEHSDLKPTLNHLLNSAAKNGNPSMVNYLIEKYQFEVTEETFWNAIASRNLKLIVSLFKEFPKISQKELNDLDNYCRDSGNLIVLYHLVTNNFFQPNVEFLRNLAFQYGVNRRILQDDPLRDVLLKHFIDLLIDTWKIEPDNKILDNIKKGDQHKSSIIQLSKKELETSENLNENEPRCSIM